MIFTIPVFLLSQITMHTPSRSYLRPVPEKSTWSAATGCVRVVKSKKFYYRALEKFRRRCPILSWVFEAACRVPEGRLWTRYGWGRVLQSGSWCRWCRWLGSLKASRQHDCNSPTSAGGRQGLSEDTTEECLRSCVDLQNSMAWACACNAALGIVALTIAVRAVTTSRPEGISADYNKDAKFFLFRKKYVLCLYVPACWIPHSHFA